MFPTQLYVQLYSWFVSDNLSQIILELSQVILNVVIYFEIYIHSLTFCVYMIKLINICIYLLDTEIDNLKVRNVVEIYVYVRVVYMVRRYISYV